MSDTEVKRVLAKLMGWKIEPYDWFPPDVSASMMGDPCSPTYMDGPFPKMRADLWNPTEDANQFQLCFEKATGVQQFNAVQIWLTQYCTVEWNNAQSAIVAYQLAPLKSKCEALAKAVEE